MAWQCRLDATGDSWLRLAHENKARSVIPADRIEQILSMQGDAPAVADTIIAELLRRGRRHLPNELLAYVREFTITWVRDAHRFARRQRRSVDTLRHGAATVEAQRPVHAQSEPTPG